MGSTNKEQEIDYCVNRYDLPKSPRARRLTESEKTQYEKWGYVKNLPVFDQDTIPVLQEYFNEMVELMPLGLPITRFIEFDQINHFLIHDQKKYDVTGWHKANRKIYDLCHTPAILDYVEDILGPNFFLWGSHCFAKFPHDGTEVPWHQDAQYYPLQPLKTVSAWLALFDTDEENAAMQIVRGSHKLDINKHKKIDLDVIKPEEVVTLDLKAGEISLHDVGIIHGSGPNNSDRIRAGLVMRYSSTEVKCDLNRWPAFGIYLVRGVDDYQHNPVAKVPRGNGCPYRLL